MKTVVEHSMPSGSGIEEPSHLAKVGMLLASMANIVRLKVLIRLSEREWSVGELARDLDISQSALSQHLSKMRAVGILRVRKDRQTVFYRCNDHLVARLLAEVGLLDRKLL